MTGVATGSRNWAARESDSSTDTPEISTGPLHPTQCAGIAGATDSEFHVPDYEPNPLTPDEVADAFRFKYGE